MAEAARIPGEQAALLAAVIAAPDDDLPRLVYADWLEEHGDAVQAAFIRESIALASGQPGPVPWGARRSALDTLAREHADDWLRAIGIEYAAPRFIRGFPERLEFALPALFFLFTERDGFARVPVRAVSIRAEKDFGLTYDDVRRLADTPELARLESFKLEGSARVWAYTERDLGAWPQFFASEHVRGLRRLGLWHCIDDDDAAALADSPTLTGLRSLALAGNGVGPDGLRLIAGSAHLRGLTDLWLFDNIPADSPDELQALTRELRARFGYGGLHLGVYPED